MRQPARAATEGIAGANNASANTRLYVKPSVVFPNRATIPYAIRFPKPDLMNPPDSQKAMAINHLHSVEPMISQLAVAAMANAAAATPACTLS